VASGESLKKRKREETSKDASPKRKSTKDAKPKSIVVEEEF
jgi:hypothetical protein